MQQEQIILYIRENMELIALAAGGVCLLIWLLVLFQVTRTRREVHKICKKIRRYFDVILADDIKEEEATEQKAEPEHTAVPVNEAAESLPVQKAKNSEEEAKLLMDVISEVF